MKPHRYLVGRVGVVIDPVPDVVKHHVCVIRDAMGSNADIAFGQAVGAGPIPHVTEHAFVERPCEYGIQYLRIPLPACACPGRSLDDILLLGLVEIGAVRDPCLLEPKPLFVFKRCSVVGFL